MSADILPELVLSFGYVLIPGIGLCLATRISFGRSFFTFLGLSFGFGYAGVSLMSLLLVFLGILGQVGLGAIWLATSAVAWAFAIRHGSIKRYAGGWRRHILEDPWAWIGSVTAVVGVALSRWAVDPIVNVVPTALRYWADGLEIADAGRIPDGTLQWGTILPPITSKVALSAFDAGVSLLLGRGPIAPLAASLVVAVVGITVIVIALFAELGIRRLAVVGALFLFVNGVTRLDLTTDLSVNLAEDWGRLAALAAVLAAVLALRAEPPDDGVPDPGLSVLASRRGSSITAGTFLGVAATTHLVAASFGLACVGALALAFLVVDRPPLRVSFARTGTIVGVAVVIGGAILASAPGELGFEGAVNMDGYRALRAELDLPPTFDPTLFIATHDVEAAQAPHDLGVGDVAVQFAYKLIGGNNSVLTDGREEAALWLLVAPSLVAIVLAIGLLLAPSAPLRVIALFAMSLGLVIFGVGVLFALRYDLFALESFGNRRLFSYGPVPIVIIVTAAGEAALASLGRHGLGMRGASVFGFAVVLVAGITLIPASAERRSVSTASLHEQVALVEWIARTVPCEGRVLADHRTLGTFKVIAGHAGVLEGMGPHIRPPVLKRAIEEILRARDFFRRPAAGRPYLRERGVAAVLVASPARAFGFGGYAISRVPPNRLDQVPFLDRAFENLAGIVYLFDDFEPAANLPTIAGRPGFSCPAG